MVVYSEGKEDVYFSGSDLLLFLMRERFLLFWNLIDFVSELNFLKKFEDVVKFRRKSLLFLLMLSEKYELKCWIWYCLKSDCSVFVNMFFVSRYGCLFFDVDFVKEKLNLWLCENLLYLNRILFIDLEIFEDNY